MYRNYMKYGDTEVANNQRVEAYVANGLTPVGAIMPEQCSDCDHLAEATGETNGEYQTPSLDNAPWYTPRRPDTGDFAGVHVVEVTGLEGSTMEVQIEERVGDGGLVASRRAASKIIGVTADVVGSTGESMSLGLEWLSSALHPPCVEGVDCLGDTLAMFSTCPTMCEGQVDPDGTPVVAVYGLGDFTSSAIMSTNPVIRNYITNPSAEAATTTPWHSNAAFGAYVVATAVDKVAPPTVLTRPNALRVTTPALTSTQRTNVVAQWTIDEDGVYEFSAWVYVPAATNLSVQAMNPFSGGSAGMPTKDKWVRVSHRETLVAGARWMGVGTMALGSAHAGGQFFYVDGAMLTRVGSLPSSANFQGASTDIDGWETSTVFGNFTPAASIATEAFTGPLPEQYPRVLKVTWGWPITGATVNSYAGVPPDGMVKGNVYTYEADLYVPAGSPDVSTDVLFNGFGDTYTTKGAWFHVHHTFVATDFNRFNLQAAPTGAGQFVRVANLRLMPGFGTMQPRTYFDGSFTDAVPVTVETPVATGAGASLTPGVLAEGEIWTRVSTTIAGHGVRAHGESADVEPYDYAEFIASWLVYNPDDVAVTVNVDWCDTQITTYTLAPGETRRVFARGARDYDGTYRFTDLAPEVDKSILFRDVTIEQVSPYNYAWTGTAEASASTAVPTSDAFVFKPAGGDNTIYGPVEVGVCDTVTMAWTVSSATGADALVQVGTATGGGEPTGWGDTVTLTGQVPVEIVMVVDASPNFPEQWRPMLWSETRQVTVHSLTVTHLPVITAEECISPYRRTLHNVVTVAGPTVVAYRTLGDTTDGSTVARVEWTWVATDPHLWHDAQPLLTNVEGRTSDPPAYQLPGVPLSPVSTVTAAATTCALPAVTALTCADNTVCGAILLPPAAPVIDNPCLMPMPTGISRRYFDIPTDLSPQGLGVLSWVFENDDRPKFGVRVRIYEDLDPAFTAPPAGTGPGNVCTFVDEFTIDYLAPDQTMYIDGPGSRVYVVCGVDAYAQPITAPALRNVRGNYGGPFRNMPIGCGKAYMVTVEVPNTYTDTDIVGAPYAAGQTQGDLLWSVSLVERG